MVQTYPGLPPIAELIPEAEDPDDAEMPQDRQEDSSSWNCIKLCGG